MSYDISLYDPEFLTRALGENLGDWTNSPALPQDALQKAQELARSAGFELDEADPEFVAFCKEQGFLPGVEYTADTPLVLAQMLVFPGSIAFQVPYGDRAETSVRACIELGKEIASATGLGFYDPQTGEVLAEIAG